MTYFKKELTQSVEICRTKFLQKLQNDFLNLNEKLQRRFQTSSEVFLDVFAWRKKVNNILYEFQEENNYVKSSFQLLVAEKDGDLLAHGETQKRLLEELPNEVRLKMTECLDEIHLTKNANFNAKFNIKPASV